MRRDRGAAGADSVSHRAYRRAAARRGDASENLALACHLCNAHKGPNLSGIDPATGRVAPLFHPRRERWSEHFTRIGGAIIGQTETGRATVAVLDMNHPARMEARLRSEP